MYMAKATNKSKKKNRGHGIRVIPANQGIRVRTNETKRASVTATIVRRLNMDVARGS